MTADQMMNVMLREHDRAVAAATLAKAPPPEPPRQEPARGRILEAGPETAGRPISYRPPGSTSRGTEPGAMTVIGDPGASATAPATSAEGTNLSADELMDILLKQHDEKVRAEAAVHREAVRQQKRHQNQAEDITSHLVQALREEANIARRAELNARMLHDIARTEVEAVRFYENASQHVVASALQEQAAFRHQSDQMTALSLQTIDARDSKENIIGEARKALNAKDEIIQTMQKEKMNFLESSVNVSAQAAGLRQALEVTRTEIAERDMTINKMQDALRGAAEEVHKSHQNLVSGYVTARDASYYLENMILAERSGRSQAEEVATHYKKIAEKEYEALAEVRAESRAAHESEQKRMWSCGKEVPGPPRALPCTFQPMR